MRNAPGTLIQIIDEVRDLRNIIETIEPILRSGNYSDDDCMGRNEPSKQMSHSVEPVILNCLSELQTLESQIRPERIEGLLESKGKAFLQALTWQLKGNDAKQSIANLQRCKASLNLAISSHNSLVIRNIERLSLSIEYKAKQSGRRIDALARDFEISHLHEQRRAISNWLSPLKPSQNHRQLKSSHQVGTTEWFRESEKFRGWLEGRITMLWLSGPQVLEGYESSRKADRCDGPALEMLLEVIQTLSTSRRIYLLIDGADEVKDYRSFSEQLATLNGSSKSIHTLMASRNEVTIQRVFAEAPRVSLEDHTLNIDKDIERYISSWLDNEEDLQWLSPEIQRLVSSSLMLKSKGKLLARTAASEVAYVRKIMAWLSLSSIPLTLHQLWEALAIEKGRKYIDDEARLRSPQDILVLGNSLITVSSEGYVMLSHLSVRDYLLSEEIGQDTKTAKFALDSRRYHMELARDCLTYLSFSELSSGPSNTQEDYLCRQRRLPLIQYASRYWFYHLLNAEYNEEMLKLCLDIFQPKARNNFMSWVQVFNATSPFKWNIYPRHATSLYYAASLGLDGVVDSLLRSSTMDEIDAPGSRFGGTAIHAAAIRDHLSIIKLLIKAGADPGKADFNEVTPLHSAAGQGNIKTIKTLLDCGAPKETRDGMDGKTPADWARLSGYLSAAQFIEQYSHHSGLTKDIDVDSDTDSGIYLDKHEEGNVIKVWKPRFGYFPDYYERRSGLDSSHIVSITVGDETSVLSNGILLLQDEGTGLSNPVW
ncbi:hypothetical protein FLAG1_07548 [Fusarium langsethiae]|uniref:GPI inositol-deacylase winged helix domain-containing protein n=1 Tax=Fusarium langsethiae TaxID=179993 RepID=A0A0M9ETI2_FUSLA|nr:hypothetical protein FLAG1_07548 [Fusarium langsethiae]GKU07978.1 unnamed protein product [Fusarium langsethiae]